MGEGSTSDVPAYPDIQAKQFMERFGFTAESIFYGSPTAAESAVGNELRKAKEYVKGWTGYSFDSTETITDERRSMLADAIYARAAYFIYLRLSNLRLDMADHYRTLARMQREEYEGLNKTLRKTKVHSKILTRSEEHTQEKIGRV